MFSRYIFKKKQKTNNLNNLILLLIFFFIILSDTMLFEITYKKILQNILKKKN